MTVTNNWSSFLLVGDCCFAHINLIALFFFISEFSLTVELTTSPRTTIKPQQRGEIFDYVQSQLPLFQKHLYFVKEIHFFNVLGITKISKDAIVIELSVTDQDELDKFFEFAKYPAKDQQNGFSACLTSFFDKQEMGLKCSFKSGTKVVFKVKMSERKRKKYPLNYRKMRVLLRLKLKRTWQQWGK